MSKEISQEIKEEIIKLRAEGKSHDEIAKKLHISKSTCYKWAGRLENEINELLQKKILSLAPEEIRNIVFKNIDKKLSDKIQFEIKKVGQGILLRILTYNAETFIFNHCLGKKINKKSFLNLDFWHELGEELTNERFNKKALEQAQEELEKQQKEFQEEINKLKNQENKTSCSKKITAENNGYFQTYSSPSLENIRQAKTKSCLPAQLDIYGNAKIKCGENFLLTIKDYKNLSNGIPTSAMQLLDCFLISFAQGDKKDTCINLPLKTYMEWRELKDPKSARKQVLKDMDILSKIGYSAKEKIRGKWVNSGDIYIFGGTKFIKNGIIRFNFNQDFYKSLLEYYISDYSKEALKIDTQKHPHAYHFLKCIDRNYRINEGKSRLETIKIKALIKESPQLPTYDDVTESDRHYYERIIEPTLKNLDIIDKLYYDIVDQEGNIIEDPWKYFKGKGGYNLFINSYLKIDYSDYPKHPNRVKNRRKYEKKKIE